MGKITFNINHLLLDIIYYKQFFIQFTRKMITNCGRINNLISDLSWQIVLFSSEKGECKNEKKIHRLVRATIKPRDDILFTYAKSEGSDESVQNAVSLLPSHLVHRMKCWSKTYYYFQAK